ncbi:flagellar brake protein [Aquabacterium sp. OR-4]|uniref:flagellar brake protein n=1 Tax=Aquabacterium sp. OR-4 TaxID=2978127 RepID=UPI0021B4A675|nr:flagellar brake protein [Aquabacterium sp. OR-4]MDT7836573.1 flagellar brake protein [Aquabacterium sp. OR-4]
MSGFQDTQPTPIGADDAGLADFRCERPGEVLALLRQVRDAEAPVALSTPSGASFSASLWSIDAERGALSLEVERADPALAGVVDGNEATAVTYLDAIKLQFDLDGLVLVRGPRATALQCRLPRWIYRFQRRTAFRVRTPERAGPSAALRHPAMPEMRLALRVCDISLGGCGLLLPADVPPLPLGIVMQGVALTLDDATRLDVSLRLQHASSLQAADGSHAGLRLGCELLALSPDDLRRLQRYIDLTQRRRRLLSLD